MGGREKGKEKEREARGGGGRREKIGKEMRNPLLQFQAGRNYGASLSPPPKRYDANAKVCVPPPPANHPYDPL